MGLQRLDVRHHLVEHLAPPLVEPHLPVLLAAFLVAVNGDGRVEGPAPARLHRDDRREERLLRGAVTWEQRVGPDQPLLRGDLQVAADIRTLGVSYVWSPAEEVGEGEGGSTELAVEPAAGVVEGDLGGEAGGEAVEGVGAVPVEAEVRDELAVDRFDDLAEAAEPAAQRRGP